MLHFQSCHYLFCKYINFLQHIVHFEKKKIIFQTAYTKDQTGYIFIAIFYLSYNGSISPEIHMIERPERDHPFYRLLIIWIGDSKRL